MKIPFNKNKFTFEDKKKIEKCLEEGFISSDGKYTELVCLQINELLNSKNILMTTSGTHALEIAALLANIKENDEVIMPSYSFPSTANAVLLRGGKPIFVDIELSTLSISLDLIKKRLTKDTKAIIPVHYGGISCDMDKLLTLSKEENIYIIEDSAQAFLSKYKNKFLGTLGNFGCYSFHGTKNIVSGEGGAILINDKKFLDRAECIIQKGTNRKSFIDGLVDKYTWVDLGSSYAPSDLLMCLLYTQLEKIMEYTKNRNLIFNVYNKYFERIVDGNKVISKITIPEYNECNYHLYYIILSSEELRNKVIHELSKKNIDARFHFMPLHLSKMGKKLGYKQGDFPITEIVANGLLRLPIYNTMSIAEAEYVAESVLKIIAQI